MFKRKFPFSSFLLLAASTLLTGCASHTTILANPDSGRMVRCAQAAYGIIPAMLAGMVHEDCVATAKEAGYTKLVSERHQ